MDRAGAAGGDAAAVLGAGQPDDVAEHPEERHVRGHVHRVGMTIDRELHVGGGPLVELLSVLV